MYMVLQVLNELPACKEWGGGIVPVLNRVTYMDPYVRLSISHYHLSFRKFPKIRQIQ